MLKVILFVIVSAAFAYVSRASLRVPRSHGFFRFFAWEEILLLTLLNLNRWFHNPFAWYQVISWILLVVSLFLAIHGARLLKERGEQDVQRNDAPLFRFEKTTTLITAGAYRYIRHPMYSSLLFLAWGVFFKSPSWLGIILALAASCFLVATAKIEEEENFIFFGKAYLDYVRRTKRFIPFLF